MVTTLYSGMKVVYSVARCSYRGVGGSGGVWTGSSLSLALFVIVQYMLLAGSWTAAFEEPCQSDTAEVRRFGVRIRKPESQWYRRAGRQSESLTTPETYTRARRQRNREEPVAEDVAVDNGNNCAKPVFVPSAIAQRFRATRTAGLGGSSRPGGACSFEFIGWKHIARPNRRSE